MPINLTVMYSIVTATPINLTVIHSIVTAMPINHAVTHINVKATHIKNESYVEQDHTICTG